MTDSTSTDLPLTTDPATQISMTSTQTSITTNPPITSSISSSNDNFRTVFVTITTSASPNYSMNATEKIWSRQSNAVGQWSAIGVICVYILFAFCLFMGWIIRCVRREPKIRPSSLPPELTQRGDGSFLATETVGIKKDIARSVKTMSAAEGSSTSKYSFEEPRGDGQSGTTLAYEGPNYLAQGSLRNLNFEDQPYLSPISSPTISNLPTSRTSQKGSSGIYGNGGRRYSSSQTNLIPLQNPPSQYQQYLGEVEAAEQTRLGSGSRGRNRSSSQSTLRYCFAQNDDDSVPPLLSMPVPAMLDRQNCNPYTQASSDGHSGSTYTAYV